MTSREIKTILLGVIILLALIYFSWWFSEEKKDPKIIPTTEHVDPHVEPDITFELTKKSDFGVGIQKNTIIAQQINGEIVMDDIDADMKCQRLVDNEVDVYYCRILDKTTLESYVCISDFQGLSCLK